MKDFISNDFYNLFGIAIGVIGIILAIVFYFKSKKIKKPFYSKVSINLLKRELKRIGNIEVKYLNQSIEDFTITKIAIWNGGHDTINKSNVPENSSLRIAAQEDSIIYGAEMLYQTDQSNGFNVFHDKINNAVQIDFDYMDINQGCIIKVLHSGISSDNLELIGKVKGVGNIKFIPNYKLETSLRNKHLPYFVSMGLYLGLLGYYVIKTPSINKIILYLGVSLFFILIGIISIFSSTKFPENLAKEFNT
jgi:hypothetical protein